MRTFKDNHVSSRANTRPCGSEQLISPQGKKVVPRCYMYMVILLPSFQLLESTASVPMCSLLYTQLINN